jgi:hypothetical protein
MPVAVVVEVVAAAVAAVADIVPSEDHLAL